MKKSNPLNQKSISIERFKKQSLNKMQKIKVKGGERVRTASSSVVTD
ncbi:hypothetical protein [Aquimarina algiphila]|nr:hypothetical protein [Aquimarina algiphila]